MLNRCLSACPFIAIFALISIGSMAWGDAIDFNQDVRAILSNKCFACHGPDDATVEAGLRLDNRKSATSELESGNIAIIAGKPDDSELFLRISSDDEDYRMPPADFGKQLTATEIETLQQWIAQGANFAKHWSYEKPIRFQTPVVQPEYKNWPRNEIDFFTLHRMAANGLQPSPEADRYAIARRVFLDLIGIPPTIDEVDAFVNNQDPDAYEELVDDLLNRKAFGEHWARKWLDLARYADSAGYADDPPRTIWGYRDWVIKSINANMPFDQFTIEQLAADLRPNASDDQLVATAFHRNTMTNNEGGTQDEEFRNVAVVDRVNTTMAVWMGTTMACAQCHNHKYDPISQEEYFQFFAIFNNTQDADRRNESPLVQLFSENQKQQKTFLANEIDALKKTMETPTSELASKQQQWESGLQSKPHWSPLVPTSITRQSKLKATIQDDGSVLVTKAAKKDAYRIDIPIGKSNSAESHISAIRLETRPHDSLPGKGTGLAGGNFVITGIQAELIPRHIQLPSARFVRITNLGNGKILSLAEVEVFRLSKNISSTGKATQHSTAFAGPPELAIDGITDGNYDNKSVTHTHTVNDPWWELDLTAEQPIEKINIWNRTDNNLHTRLANFKVELLDQARKPVWSKTIQESPHPSATISPTNLQKIEFAAAFADYHQPDFEPADVLTGKTGKNDGWAVGGKTTDVHQLVLVAKQPIPVRKSAILRVIVQQNSPHTNHLLGHFQLGSTSDESSIQRAKLPKHILAILDVSTGDRSPEDADTLAKYFRENVSTILAKKRTELVSKRKQLAEIKPATSVPILREIADKQRKTHLQFRGNYLDRGQEVRAGLPGIFGGTENGNEKPVDRLELARWLVDDDNPLTARVLANRFWETIFGRGIVVTSEEFGSQGELPTHPQLLDWLATELFRNQWNTKALIRKMVTSATYRQASRVTPEQIARDPDNRWVARGPRIRLSAEMVRDQALAVSGLLSPKLYGPPVKPPQPNLGLTAAFGSSTDWKPSQGEDRYRRGIYTTWRRSNPYPSMATFDAPNREVCTVRRNRTNTPLQSLVTLNDPVYVEAAQSLARKMLMHCDDLENQIVFGFRSCLLRPPTKAETMVLVSLFHDSKEQFADKIDEAQQLATQPLGKLPEGMSTVEAASMTVVSNVLLNLDEMFLKR